MKLIVFSQKFRLDPILNQLIIVVESFSRNLNSKFYLIVAKVLNLNRQQHLLQEMQSKLEGEVPLVREELKKISNTNIILILLSNNNNRINNNQRELYLFREKELCWAEFFRLMSRSNLFLMKKIF